MSTKHDVRVKRDEHASSLTEDVKQADGGVEKKELKLTKIKKNGKFEKCEDACFHTRERQCLIYIIYFSENLTKIQRSSLMRKKRKLPFSTILTERKVLNNETISISSYSGEIRWQSGDGKNTSAVENQILDHIEQNITIERQQRETFGSVSVKHHRNTRDIKQSTETLTEMKQCKNFIFVIKYEDPYEIGKYFSIKYKGKIYHYYTYRVKNDGLYVCNSSDDLIQQRWKNVTVQDKQRIPYKHCNVSVDSFYHENYTLFKDFNVFFKPTSQYFTREDYGVISGYFSICSSKLSLSCNDYLVKVNFSEQYNVFNDFSLIYNNRKYDYREYRINNNTIEMCASNHSTVLHIWKTRNSLEKSGFLRPLWYQYTKEDLLMCNDSIININYDDEYKVWNNFSILYKNKMYSYTEYRALNDGIKICNSTDNFTKNIWKLRNYWVMWTRHSQSCNFDYLTIDNYHYIVDKLFIVYYSRSSQYFTKPNYDVGAGKPDICKQTLRPDSYQYTKEDLLMCNDSIINIKYDDEYKVWNNFSILYKNKMYSYNECRALNDSIKICNSTDNFTKNIWKLRNKWVMETKILKVCNTPVVYFPLYQGEYVVAKGFTVLIEPTKLLIGKNNYGIFKDIPFLCVNKCTNSTFTISYEDEYRVWNNFSMMYKGQMFHYFEYRVTDNGLRICNSSDRLIKEKWQNLTALERRATAYAVCNGHVGGFYHENYTVYKNFSVFLKPTDQSFARHDYGVILGYFAICLANLSFSCEESLLKVKYGEQYKVFKNFSMFYNNTVYDYREYRFSMNGVKICTSNDVRVQAIWKTQNKWGKSLSAPCDRSFKLNPREYIVTKEFAIHSTDDGQTFNRYKYAVIDDSPYVCNQLSRPNIKITDVNIIIAPLFALALSFIYLVLLLMIHCLLPELRTLPGLNLMSLCFAFLLWQIYLVVLLSLFSLVSKLSSIPCERLFVITKFITYSIIMNAAVNIYHLRKTFCGNTLVKAEGVNKWRKFLKYSVFSWGVPVGIAIVYIVLVKTQTLQFNQHRTYVKRDVPSSLRFYQRIEFADEDAKGNGPHTTSKRDNFAPCLPFFSQEDEHNVSIKRAATPNIAFYKRIVLGNENNNKRIYHHITGDCINGRITPSWLTAVDVYGIQGCLMLYIAITFIFTAYKIRQKLKAGQSIAQKSNVVKRRKFILLLKLSTTTALSYWFPLFLSEMIDFNFDVKIAFYTVTLLTGAYIGIAFGFTRRNYQLLKKKYFPAKDRPVNNRVAANQ